MSSSGFFAKFLNISPSHAFLAFPNLLWGSAGDDPATGFSAAGAHIDDVAGVSDHIKVMFDDNDSGAVVYKCLENLQECLDIKGMEADGGLIKDEDGIGLSFPHFAGKLQALGFAAGEAGCFFPKSQVTKAEVFQDF